MLSLDPVQFAMPVELLLRTVLEEARSYDEARALLSESLIPCDCLLLLTGTRPGEMAVIERTPTRHAVRGAKAGYVCVTNGYQALDVAPGGGSFDLMGTCCGRLERVEDLISRRPPGNPDECFRYLSDADVQMNMTVQQMVFRVATGEYWTRLPQAL